MAKLAEPVQFRLGNAGTDADWVAAIVVKVDAVDATKLDLALFPPGKPMTQRQGIMPGTAANQWREIP